MYNTLKKNIKTLIPKRFLHKNELFIRKFYAAFYKGNKHECPVCSHQIKQFITLENNDLLCPFCGSISRNRRLWILLQEHLTGKMLHFSPSRSLFRNLKNTDTLDYYSSDFENEFIADYKFDITNINQESEKFDTIICYHILEHIVYDSKAMSELYRVLKKTGTVFIQTPFKDGDIYEDDNITSPQDREKYFGQHDHVRIYSAEGLKKRLKAAGFKVAIKSFNNPEADFYNGFKSPETVLVASKL
ncbi:class I SAM-dependent methyltransferase [Tamlana haliotis]|uniref:Class I SAM-dependent methyltransferase n=1 Tax=Pseudotamlana haliotis TaxID=2614804 RepID=A0A6N6MHH8_9FLAO|nr:methyltransferase domain-containing protein [Tamlana haliotis]KAB1068221.1 class I SAM-dependent methyltransferase [Tamlana haliotis]